MIQRIQTVFLLLAVISIGVFLYMPLIGFSMNKDEQFKKGWEVGQTFVFSGQAYFYFITAIFAGTAAILTFINIFFYKNRSFQMLVCWFAIVFTVCAVGFVFYQYETRECYYDSFSKKILDCESILTPWNLLAIAAVVFEVAAYFFIRKDEELLKSADRLRD